MSEPTTDRVSFELPSVLGNIEPVEEAVEAFAQRAGFDEDDAGHIALATREATVNAIKHANGLDPQKKFKAEFELSDDALTIRISDEGPGFDPDKIPDPLAEENMLRTSGRGVFMMRAIMDEVHFRQLSRGTEITMKKHRTTTGGA